MLGRCALLVSLFLVACPSVPEPSLPDDADPKESSDNSLEPDDTADDTEAPPTADTGPACPECTWSVSDWTDCTVTCGPVEGEQSRTVECIDGDGEATELELCDPETEPPTMQTCLAAEACTWVTEDWGVCSETCGEGLETRGVSCQDPVGTTVDVTWCAPEPAPDSQRNCFVTSACAWFESGFSACDTTCGEGEQTQTVSCQGPTGTFVDPSWCPQPQPPNVQDCLDTTTCGWDVGNWSTCPATCQGDTDTQTRLVTCEDTAGGIVTDAWCPGPKPAESQSCSGTQPNVSWNVGSWGICEEFCVQTRTVSCPSGCCTGSQPPSLQSCSGGLCDLCDPICP
ncbi:MAG: thrombospondin type-1 domain-containing protein [Myxococcota bacterium]